MGPLFIRGMQYAIDQLYAERDSYQPFTLSWQALNNAAIRLCGVRDRRRAPEVFAGFVAEDPRRIDEEG